MFKQCIKFDREKNNIVADIIVKKVRQQATIVHKYLRPTPVFMWNSSLRENFTLVLIAGFRAGLAGLNRGYPKNAALKPREPS